MVLLQQDLVKLMLSCVENAKDMDQNIKTSLSVVSSISHYLVVFVSSALLCSSYLQCKKKSTKVCENRMHLIQLIVLSCCPVHQKEIKKMITKFGLCVVLSVKERRKERKALNFQKLVWTLVQLWAAIF